MCIGLSEIMSSTSREHVSEGCIEVGVGRQVDRECGGRGGASG